VEDLSQFVMSNVARKMRSLKSEEKKNKAERQILPSHSLEKFQWEK